MEGSPNDPFTVTRQYSRFFHCFSTNVVFHGFSTLALLMDICGIQLNHRSHKMPDDVVNGQLSTIREKTIATFCATCTFSVVVVDWHTNGNLILRSLASLNTTA